MIAYSYNDPRSCLPPPSHSQPPPSYSQHPNTPPSPSPSSSYTILLSCPRLSSFNWCLKLYAIVCGGCGAIFSVLWLVGQTYVLSQTGEKDLRLQRYVDIILGLSLLISHLLLSYGSVQERKVLLTLFFILSMSVLILYWLWWCYLKYGKGESEASKEMSDTGFLMTLVYLLLLLPILLLYRTLHSEENQGEAGDRKEEV